VRVQLASQGRGLARRRSAKDNFRG
jgi:hypothetical protein